MDFITIAKQRMSVRDYKETKVEPEKLEQILEAAQAGDWDGASMALQHHLELARDKAEGVIKVIRLW